MMALIINQSLATCWARSL